MPHEECPVCRALCYVEPDGDAVRLMPIDQTDLAWLRADNKRLREALEHYVSIGILPSVTNGNRGVDLGAVAREALSDSRNVIACEWQPIETAPKGITRILVYSEVIGVTEACLPYSDDSVMHRTERGGMRVPSPTHWMPLPAPPKDAA